MNESKKELQNYIFDKILYYPTIPDMPFDPDDKIFHYTDDQGDEIGDPYCYNDWLKEIEKISGVNDELLGEE